MNPTEPYVGMRFVKPISAYPDTVFRVVDVGYLVTTVNEAVGREWSCTFENAVTYLRHGYWQLVPDPIDTLIDEVL